jgi:hypothetical protein
MKFKVGEAVRLSKSWTGCKSWRRESWRLVAPPRGSAFYIWISNGEHMLPAEAHEIESVHGLVAPENRSRVDAGPRTL